MNCYNCHEFHNVLVNSTINNNRLIKTISFYIKNNYYITKVNKRFNAYIYTDI